MDKKDECLTVFLDGEIDHCSAQRMRIQIEKALCDKRILSLRLGFSGVTFMDSSGVGMLIGRYKTMAARGGKVSAYGLSGQMARLFNMAGLHRIIAIEEENA